MSDDFYKRLDEKERNGRIARIFADRPENLHDYQGCTNASKLPSAPSPAEETASEPVRKVLTRADIAKMNEGNHRCGWTTGAVKNPNPACGCMCGTVYAPDGNPIISHGERHSGARCKHADERGRLIAHPESVSPEGAAEHWINLDLDGLYYGPHGESLPSGRIIDKVMQAYFDIAVKQLGRDGRDSCDMVYEGEDGIETAIGCMVSGIIGYAKQRAQPSAPEAAATKCVLCLSEGGEYHAELRSGKHLYGLCEGCADLWDGSAEEPQLIVAAPVGPAAAVCRRAFNAVRICNDDAGHIGPCNWLPSKAGLVTAPAAASETPENATRNWLPPQIDSTFLQVALASPYYSKLDKALAQEIVNFRAWLEQTANLLNLYLHGFNPKDVARDLLAKITHNWPDMLDDINSQTASAASPVAGVSGLDAEISEAKKEFIATFDAYREAQKVWRHLVKRMYYECGATKADEFIRRVESGEHDVPSPWLAQPSAEGDGAYDAFLTGEVLYHENRLTVTNGRIGLYWHDDAGHAHKLGDYITPEQEAVFRERMAKSWKPRKLAEGDGWIAVTERLPEVAKADNCCIPEDEAPIISEPVIVWNEDDCEQVVAELEIVDGSAAGAVWRSLETGKEIHGVTHYKLSTPPSVQEEKGTE